MPPNTPAEALGAGLVVGRTGLTIRGDAPNYIVAPFLRRSEGGTFYPVLYVPPNITVTIADLGIDGGRYTVSGLGCLPLSGWTYADVYVDPLATAYLTDVWISASPATGLWITQGWIQLSRVDSARSTGIYLDGDATALSNVLVFNGTAAVNVRGSGHVYWNYFYNNRREMPDGTGGGQLYFDQLSGSAIAAENYIDGANYVVQRWDGFSGGQDGICYANVTETQGVTGVEGRSNGNTLYNNEVIYNTGNGITWTGSNNTTIAGEDAIQSGNAPKYVENNVGFGIVLHDVEGPNLNFRFVHPRSINNTSYLLDISVASSTTGVGYGLDSTGFITACVGQFTSAVYLPYLVNKVPQYFSSTRGQGYCSY